MTKAKNKLWRSPVASIWVLLLVLTALLLTVLKINSGLCYIPKTFKTTATGIIEYDLFDLLLYGAWLIGPPVFFLLEYVYIFGKEESRRMDDEQITDMKYCQDLAGKIWAAVGVMLGLMLLVRYGIKF